MRTAYRAVFAAAFFLLMSSGAIAQQPVLREGHTSIMYEAKGGWQMFVDQVKYREETAFRFAVAHYHTGSAHACQGYLYVTPTRIAYDPAFSPQSQDGFVAQRREIKETKGGGGFLHRMVVILPNRNYAFIALSEKGTRRRHELQDEARSVSQFFAASANDFSRAENDFQTLTASLNQAPSAESRALQASPDSNDKRRHSQVADISNQPSTVELKEGQTPEEVERVLGKPEDIISLKQTVVYVYPTVKVFFESGKLVNVEERKK